MSIRRFFTLLLTFILFGLHAQEQSGPAAYDKQVHMIEMRDGVSLYTVVYTPKNDAQDYPILLWRTPYSVAPYGDEMREPLSANPWLLEEGYIFVFQDVRGRFMSEGDFVNMRPVRTSYTSDSDVDETTDTWDSVEWLIQNTDHNNGKVGLYGISYPGFYAALAGIHAHPAIKCISPQAPISDWFRWDDMHHNGALCLPLVYNFFRVFGIERPEPVSRWPRPLGNSYADAYHFFLESGSLKQLGDTQLKGQIHFWNELCAHPDYDTFWQSRSTLSHFKDVQPAVLTVGGWYDGEDLAGALYTYRSIEKLTTGADNRLVMGPWTHGAWAQPARNNPSKIPFREQNSSYFQEFIEAPFFAHHLKSASNPGLPEAWVYETGSESWKSYDCWPPEGEQRSYYLDAEGALLSHRPEPGAPAFNSFISDPSRPVPYTTGFHRAGQMYHRQYLSEDQRFAATRPDVLVFEGPDLEEDLLLAGPVEVELFVSTTGTDADWVVKLIDVFPDTAHNRGLDPNDVLVSGYQMLVRADIMRGKYRESLSHPAPFVPGEVTRIRFRLHDINHCFKKGHRLMVQVQSSWFPLFDRNPQTFTNIYECDEEAFIKATHKVYHSREYPSNIRVSVVNASK